MDTDAITTTKLDDRVALKPATKRTIRVTKLSQNKVKATIVDGATQNGKTSRVFQELIEQTMPKSDTLCLFITQANSVTAVHQIIGRASRDDKIATLYPTITSTTEFKEDTFDHPFGSNVLLVGFWNARNVGIMFEAIDAYRFKEIMIIIDECDSGGVQGVLARFDFIHRVEQKAMGHVRLIFVTATVANLSKAVLVIGTNFAEKYATGIVHNIIFDSCVKHVFVANKQDYVGPSWFVNSNPQLLHLIPKLRRNANETPFAFQIRKRDATLNKLAKLNDDKKELALVVISNRMEEHRVIAATLIRNSGFNVVAIMNSEQNKNYLIFYLASCGSIKQWILPFSKIENLAANGDLAWHKKDRTGFNSKFDITISYMLQAALFMDTNAEERIRKNVVPEEFLKLHALSEALTNTAILGKTHARPRDWPETPRVSLIAGAIAGRGNTFQNQTIDLACTAFVFAGATNSLQCGAMNAQRFGRACGLLGEIFIHQNRRPALITTEAIIRDALANEAALCEKAEQLKDGEFIALKDLISKTEWEKVLDMAKAKIEKLSTKHRDLHDLHNIRIGTIANKLLLEYFTMTDKGTATFTYADINNNAITRKIHATDHHRSHRMLITMGMIAETSDKLLSFTQKGRDCVVRLSKAS